MAVEVSSRDVVVYLETAHMPKKNMDAQYWDGSETNLPDVVVKIQNGEQTQWSSQIGNNLDPDWQSEALTFCNWEGEEMDITLYDNDAPYNDLVVGNDNAKYDFVTTMNMATWFNSDGTDTFTDAFEFPLGGNRMGNLFYSIQKFDNSRAPACQFDFVVTIESAQAKQKSWDGSSDPDLVVRARGKDSSGNWVTKYTSQKGNTFAASFGETLTFCDFPSWEIDFTFLDNDGSYDSLTSGGNDFDTIHSWSASAYHPWKGDDMRSIIAQKDDWDTKVAYQLQRFTHSSSRAPGCGR